MPTALSSFNKFIVDLEPAKIGYNLLRQDRKKENLEKYYSLY